MFKKNAKNTLYKLVIMQKKPHTRKYEASKKKKLQ